MVKIDANTKQCILCGNQADFYWPVNISYILAYPYCKECLKKEEEKHAIILKEIKERYEDRTAGNKIV